jgi:hypothetical protein
MIDIATYKQMHPPDPKKPVPVMNQDEYVYPKLPLFLSDISYISGPQELPQSFHSFI